MRLIEIINTNNELDAAHEHEKEFICFKAEGLDIVGADVSGIMDRTKV